MASPSPQHDFLDPPEDGEGDALGRLGHYKVLRELGKGGMGYVFLGEDTRLQRQVALKVMNQKIAATPGSRKRFISEARSMAAVHHDNVATIFEVGEHKGTPYMAMELLRGATLENYRETHGAPAYRQIIAFAKDIARGLAAAHEKGIVHRDIKPANIWLDTNSNRLKILDFGLALAQTPVDQLSGRGSVVGTPGYLSPEQARSEPLDDRSDLYSAGVVLYELACGALPLKSKTVAEQLIAILAHEPQPLRERNDKIPQPLAELIHRLMAKEPRDRYANAKTLVAELDRVEVECEKKSEVAQAISQLQAGLEQAVKKKSGGGEALFDEDAAAAATPNPFESIPDVMPSLPPAAVSASPSGMQPAAAGSGGPPAGATLRSGATLPADPPRRTVPAADDHTRKLIWIVVAAAAAILLITIPLAVYYSSANAIARQQGQAATVLGTDSPAPTPAKSPPAKSPPAKSPPAKSARAKSAPAKSARASDEKSNADRPRRPQGSATRQRPARQDASQQAAKRNGGSKPGGGMARQPAAEEAAATPKPSPTPQANVEKPKPKPKPDPSMVSVAKPAAEAPRPDAKVEQAAATAAKPSPAPDRVVTLKTSDQGGADASVRRGGSSKEPLGGKPGLEIQTRNNAQIQHVYLRFPLSSLDGGKAQQNSRNRRGGQSKRGKRPVVRAQLKLEVAKFKSPGAVNVRVYGLADAVSDLWPEQRLVWSNSLSEADLKGLQKLAEQSISGSEKYLTVESDALNEFVATASQRSVTFVLTGSTGNEWVEFASKEQSGRSAPTLTVGLSR